MKKNKIFLSLLIIILIILTFFLFQTISNHDEINEAISKKVLTTNTLGNVTVEGPYGNENSSIKIAFIVGVHPLESNSHEALLNIIRNKSKSLNYSYYIYIINVTKDKNDFDKGRLNGQLLARDYVVPEIIKNNYTFVVDIHSHRPVYEEDNFIISPINDEKSKEIGEKIIEGIKGMYILKFEAATDNSPSSPDYITIPIIKNGTSSIIYETLLNEPSNVTYSYLSQFIDNLDNLNLYDFS
ncbi:MAG: hypothetical protein FWH54_05545 [Methanobrevibacter sp.]|nr:hypothetical protein [Methanobrevibacter sp.]